MIIAFSELENLARTVERSDTYQVVRPYVHGTVRVFKEGETILVEITDHPAPPSTLGLEPRRLAQEPATQLVREN